MNEYERFFLGILDEEDFLVDIYSDSVIENLLEKEVIITNNQNKTSANQETGNKMKVKRLNDGSMRSIKLIKRAALFSECEFYKNKNKELKKNIDDLQIQVNSLKDLIVNKLLHLQK